MNWRIIAKKDFISIEKNPVWGGKVNVSFTPVEVDEDNIKCISKFFDRDPSVYDVRLALDIIQKEYDKSDDVNYFLLDNIKYWLDKDTRMSLLNSMAIEKEHGKTTTILWLGHHHYEIDIDYLTSFIKDLELYAKDTFNVTQSHLADIAAMDSNTELVKYDITKNYP